MSIHVLNNSVIPAAPHDQLVIISFPLVVESVNTFVLFISLL